MDSSDLIPPCTAASSPFRKNGHSPDQFDTAASTTGSRAKWKDALTTSGVTTFQFDPMTLDWSAPGPLPREVKRVTHGMYRWAERRDFSITCRFDKETGTLMVFRTPKRKGRRQR